MANGNLHVSSEFFKTLSLESRQLNHTLHLLGTFAHRASVRGQELGDRRMVIIHHQLELFVSTAKRHAEGIEKLMRSVAIVGMMVSGAMACSRNPHFNSANGCF